MSLCRDITNLFIVEGRNQKKLLSSQIKEACNNSLFSVVELYLRVLLFVCWLCRFPSYLCLGIGQVCCPGANTSHPHSTNNKQIQTHFIVLSDDHHCYCSLCGQKEQNGAVSRFRQECSLKSKHPHPIIISLFILFLMYFVIYKSFCLLCPDFPPPFAVRWEPCYRPGKHQKTQVFTSSFASHLVLKFS